MDKSKQEEESSSKDDDDSQVHHVTGVKPGKGTIIQTSEDEDKDTLL
jgi:hypothetical protein